MVESTFVETNIICSARREAATKEELDKCAPLDDYDVPESIESFGIMSKV